MIYLRRYEYILVRVFCSYFHYVSVQYLLFIFILNLHKHGICVRSQDWCWCWRTWSARVCRTACRAFWCRSCSRAPTSSCAMSTPRLLSALRMTPSHRWATAASGARAIAPPSGTRPRAYCCTQSPKSLYSYVMCSDSTLQNEYILLWVNLKNDISPSYIYNTYVFIDARISIFEWQKLSTNSCYSSWNRTTFVWWTSSCMRKRSSSDCFMTSSWTSIGAPRNSHFEPQHSARASHLFERKHSTEGLTMFKSNIFSLY